MNDPKEPAGGWSRRDFLQSSGLAAAATALGTAPAPALGAPAAQEAAAVPAMGPGAVRITLNVNGQKMTTSVEPRVTLLDALRNYLDVTGCKRVCDRGTCGACTVWVDGTPVYACTLLAVECEGRAITTVEGLGSPEKPSAVQKAFWREDAMQCGFCTPGFVMSTTWAVNTYGKDLTAEQVKAATAGNLCRCGTYPHVVRAALAAAKERV
jgi:xanthine dehydrogenase YagT iron-sulfur-binding subunit